MDSIQLLQRLHQHRAWVNNNLLDAAAQLSDEQLHAAFEIGQGSVWKSLVHMQAAEYVWLETLLGNELALFPGDLPGAITGNQQSEGGIRDFGDLRAKWTAQESRWSSYLAALQPAALEETIYRTRGTGGAPMRFGVRRGDALLHVCTHAQYTTAQVVNMLRRLGVQKLPDVMLFAMARMEGA